MVSVIIPVYNNIEYTKQLIQSLKTKKAGCEFEIIIVDNNSSDGTREFILSEGAKGLKGQYVYNGENKGYAIANNQGFIKSNPNYKYICLLNNDTIVTDNWLIELVECMERHEKCVIVGSKLIHPGKGTIQHAGVFENKTKYPQHIYFGKDKDYKLANEEKEYFAVTGACILVDKKFYSEVEGLDTKYWCGWEDIDICQKAHQLGKEVWYNPKSALYHYEGQTEGRMSQESSNFNVYMRRWVLNK